MICKLEEEVEADRNRNDMQKVTATYVETVHQPLSRMTKHRHENRE
jgi:hypothetical protein